MQKSLQFIVHFFLSSVLIGLIECSAGILMVPSINLAVRLHKFQTQKEYILSPPTLTAWQECRGSQTHSSKKRRGLNSEDIVILCTRGNRKRRHIAVPGFLPFPSLLCNHLIFCLTLCHFSQNQRFHLFETETDLSPLTCDTSDRVLFFTHPYLPLPHNIMI